MGLRSTSTRLREKVIAGCPNELAQRLVGQRDIGGMGQTCHLNALNQHEVRWGYRRCPGCRRRSAAKAATGARAEGESEILYGVQIADDAPMLECLF